MRCECKLSCKVFSLQGFFQTFLLAFVLSETCFKLRLWKFPILQGTHTLGFGLYLLGPWDGEGSCVRAH